MRKTMEKLKVRCTCEGLSAASVEKEKSLKDAGAMSFIIKRTMDGFVHGGWKHCRCEASKMMINGPYKVLHDEKPGDEYRNPEDEDFSILMLIVVDLKDGPARFVARWSYSVDCFVVENDNEVIGPETLSYHTKLWLPLPVISERLWDTTFPKSKTSKEE